MTVNPFSFELPADRWSFTNREELLSRIEALMKERGRRALLVGRRRMGKTSLLLRAAEKAMRYRESIELDPMIPSERRIVHLTLATHEFVTTHSEGEGDNRRVIVEPTPDYVQQHGGPAERSERPGPGRGGFSRGGRPGGGRGRNFGGGYRGRP